MSNGDMSNGKALTVNIAVMVCAVAAGAVSVALFVQEQLHETELRMERFTEFMERGGRWTEKDGLENRRRIERLEADYKSLPPDWFRDKIEEMDQRIQQLERRRDRRQEKG